MGPCFLILFDTSKTERAKVFLLRLVHTLCSAQKFDSSLFSNSYLLKSCCLNWGSWGKYKNCLGTWYCHPTKMAWLAEFCLYQKMLENWPPLELKNNATSDIFQSELNWASYVIFVKTDDARTMPGCRTPFSFSLVYLLCVKSSPKPLFVYLRGEHCLNAGRTLSTCGENGFPFVQQPPVSRFTHVSSRVYFATLSIRPPWDLVILTNQSTAYMPQVGSNLRLSQLHPLRPSQTDQSQG